MFSAHLAQRLSHVDFVCSPHGLEHVGQRLAFQLALHLARKLLVFLVTVDSAPFISFATPKSLSFTFSPAQRSTLAVFTSLCQIK